MKFTFQAKTYAECAGFMKLIYEGSEYTLEEFSMAFKRENFDLEKLLPQCVILYRGQRKTFSEYVNERRTLGEYLVFFRRYHEEVHPIEPSLAIGAFDYYRAAKFLEKAADCLQTARYYFFESTDILKYDCCVNWRAGYQAIYDLRTKDFQTAIIWYNNCFDYIVQVAFLAFELYRGIRRYDDSLSLEEVLKMCTYNALKTLHDNQLENKGLDELWNIIEKCRTARQELNDWANYSKHKGGLGFVGLNPESPIQIFVGTPDGGFEPRISEFEMIKLDMDECVEKVIEAHNALITCLNDLMDFINFPGARHRIVDGRFAIPNKAEYRKVFLENI